MRQEHPDGHTLYSINTHFEASTTAFKNIVEKGEIALNKQFLLFPQCFLQANNYLGIIS